MKNSMKIMFLAYFDRSKNGNVQFGGAEKVFTNLANWIAENTNHIIVFASIGRDILPYRLSNKVIYKYYSSNLDSRINTHISLIKNVNYSIKDVQPDAIISFSVYPLFYALFGCNTRNIPLFFSIRNDPKLEHSRITRLVRYFVLKKSAGVVFQTKQAQEYFSSSIQKKSVIIHNPVVIDKDIEPKIEMDNRVVFVGRLDRQKNIKLLIDAFNDIHNKYKNLQLEIYGDGNLKTDLETYICEEKVTDCVKLMGACPDVISRINGARLFVLPSLYEGMPNALMEAMALGVPVISSNCPCGGPAELIEDGVNGFLFDNNSKQQLIKKMIFCLKSDSIDIIRKKEKEIGITHSPNTIFSQWITFIEQGRK